MPALAALLVMVIRWLVFNYAGKVVLAILAFFGLSLATQKFVVAPFTDAIAGMMNSGPGGTFASMAIQWMGVLNFDKAVTMIISAFVTAQAIKGAKVALSKVAS